MYQQALESLQKLKKEKLQDSKEMKLKLETLKSHKDAAQKLQQQVHNGNAQTQELNTNIALLEVREDGSSCFPWGIQGYRRFAWHIISGALHFHTGFICMLMFLIDVKTGLAGASNTSVESTFHLETQSCTWYRSCCLASLPSLLFYWLALSAHVNATPCACLPCCCICRC